MTNVNWKFMDIFAVRCLITIKELNVKYTLKGIFDCDHLEC